MLMMPTIMPMRLISFWLTRLVENARALGGVLIGNTIALDDAMAMPMSTVAVPPMASSLSPIAPQTMARIGMSRAAVAEFEMKFESR